MKVGMRPRTLQASSKGTVDWPPADAGNDESLLDGLSRAARRGAFARATRGSVGRPAAALERAAVLAIPDRPSGGDLALVVSPELTTKHGALARAPRTHDDRRTRAAEAFQLAATMRRFEERVKRTIGFTLLWSGPLGADEDQAADLTAGRGLRSSNCCGLR